MSEHEIRCGDVDGRGRFCCFLDMGRCNITRKFPRDVSGMESSRYDNMPCHCPDARHAALVAQLGEAGAEGHPDV